MTLQCRLLGHKIENVPPEMVTSPLFGPSWFRYCERCKDWRSPRREERHLTLDTPVIALARRSRAALARANEQATP